MENSEMKDIRKETKEAIETTGEVTQANEMQIQYAEVLHWIAVIGFGLLLLTFFIYMTGLLPPLVPPEKVPQMWHMEAEEYVEANRIPTGWRWVSSLGHGDILAFASLIFLAAGTILCFIITLFSFLKRREFIYSAIIAAEILVLLLAASGLVSGGH